MEIKLPLYDILNIFLTGLVFIGGCVLLFSQYIIDLLKNEIIKGLSAGPEIVITVCVFAILKIFSRTSVRELPKDTSITGSVNFLSISESVCTV